jgi:hypothetical protein
VNFSLDLSQKKFERKKPTSFGKNQFIQWRCNHLPCHHNAIPLRVMSPKKIGKEMKRRKEEENKKTSE